MATTIVNPPNNNSGGNGMGFLLGAIILIVCLALFFVYVLPYIQNSMSRNGGVQVTVPKSIDINVNQSKDGY